MDVAATDPGDAESDTFFSEIDVVDKNTPAGPEKQTAEADVDHYKTADGKARFTIVYGDAPDLKDWSREKLVPQMQKWYPIICDLLKSEGLSRRSSSFLSSRTSTRVWRRRRGRM